MLITVKYLNNNWFLLGRQVGFEEICCIQHWQKAHWLNILLINCLSTYTSYNHIQRHLKRTKKDSGQTPVKRTKISRQPFYSNRQCLFCGEQCSKEIEKKNLQRWREYFECRTSDRDKGKLPFKEVILQVRRSVTTWMLIIRFDT